ncbi:GntR family transcriptional regulator [Novosphingobium kunmingense]|uniref:GntR family transcriptional regulator n=1 Tax=Novosphingobium kunmingense TaxID=1211806 RepID=A0A2N0H366_9SPHN|nr:UTRA domain-containing protein [Novosphingobium kunmingense]PKB13385.1 GntR family transcriptional regulator [Novosphingobium kunmingense]
MTRPLGDRIRVQFERQILSGDLPPGARLPTEQEIMARFGCSRMTVSKALSALATAGLIERRKRAGTFVARPRVHSMVLEVPDLAPLIAARGQTYAFRLDRSEELAVREGHLAGRPARHLVGVHFADRQGIAVEDRLVSLAAVPDIARADLAREAPGTWLLRHVPWTEADTRITAVGAAPQEASLLGLSPGDPCLCVERRTWRGRDPITFVRQVFRGDSYELVAHFGPGAS